MSDDLYFEGKRYISVKRASEATGYTSDYVGQLCRQNKLASRQVGRVWYIEYNSLVAHKLNNLTKKEKTEDKKPLAYDTPPRTLVSPRLPSRAVSNIKYLNDEGPLLPGLQKLRSIKRVARMPRSYAGEFAVACLVIALSISWLSYAAPQSLAMLTSKLAKSAQMLSSGFKDSLAATETSQPNTADTQSTTNQNGLVVLPDSTNRGAKVAAIEQEFSDDTQVTFDADGASGVITPNFHNGAPSDNYAFVMVPIKQK